jgi:hypothetical protein
VCSGQGSSHTLLRVMLAVVGVCFVCVASSSAAVIISDSFAGTNGDAVHNRTPDTTNLPGQNWFSQGTGIDPNTSNNPFGLQPVINGNAALLSVNSSAFISLQSAGSYVKPAQFTVSADLMVGTTAGNFTGVGIGFNNINSAFDITQEISLGANGDLNLKQVLIAHYNSANFSGQAFNPNSFYHLTYLVDTVSGGVSDVILSNAFGTQFYSVSTTVFTNAKTAYVGIFANTTAAGTSGKVDNFLLTNAPEPASLALLVMSGAALLRPRRAGL